MDVLEPCPQLLTAIEWHHFEDTTGAHSLLLQVARQIKIPTEVAFSTMLSAFLRSLNQISNLLYENYREVSADNMFYY